MSTIVKPTVHQIGLNNKLIQFAKESNKSHMESFDLLSALVNLVDTARENPNQFNREDNGHGEFTGTRMTQEMREQEIVSFILAHRA